MLVRMRKARRKLHIVNKYRLNDLFTSSLHLKEMLLLSLK